MTAALYSPFWSIALSIAAFEIGIFVNRKTKLSFMNPYFIAVFVCMLFIKIFSIPMDAYRAGGSIISALLPPATAFLAVSMYGQLQLLKKYFVAILTGCLVGALTAWISVTVLCHVFKIPNEITLSMLPKSVSTPFALAISEKLGGVRSLTAAAVAVTGITGGVFGPTIARLCRVENPVAVGVAFGVSSHAIGTARAIELGDTQGAMSGVALCVSGIFTVIISVVVSSL